MLFYLLKVLNKEAVAHFWTLPFYIFICPLVFFISLGQWTRFASRWCCGTVVLSKKQLAYCAFCLSWDTVVAIVTLRRAPYCLSNFALLWKVSSVYGPLNNYYKMFRCTLKPPIQPICLSVIFNIMFTSSATAFDVLALVFDTNEQPVVLAS